MKECFFCLEQMLDQEYVCKNCKNWQPSKPEIDKHHRKVINSLTISHMGAAGFYKGIFRGILLWVLLTALFLVYKALTEEGLFFEQLIIAFKERFIEKIIGGSRGVWGEALLPVIFSVEWEFMRSRSHVEKDKYLIERSLRYQLQSVQTTTFHYVHFVIVGTLILVAILLLK